MPSLFDIGGGQGEVLAQALGQGSFRKLTGPFVGEDVRLALGVKEGGVGRAVVVEVRPDESSRPFHAGKRLYHLKRSVAVVSQHERLTDARGDDQVEIAVHVVVRRPGAVIVGVKGRGVEAGFRGHVGELALRILLEKAQTARAGEQQIRPERVAPIDREDAVSRR